MSDGRRLSPLDHAVFIILTALATVRVTEVDFHARDPIAEMDKGILHQFFDLRCEAIAPADLPVRIDLDMQRGPCRAPRQQAGRH